jgi:glutathione S-transferase
MQSATKPASASATVGDLKVYVFPPAWGLPTTGPFALKLEAWLRLAKLPYERVVEGDPRKGPKGKNPWIQLDGETLGDTGVIIERLSVLADVDLDAELDERQRATALALTRLVEDHLHQILEYELFLTEEGFAAMRALFQELLPKFLAPVVARAMRKHFKSQLYARGITRHDPAEIARQGRADIDAVAAILGDKPWLFGDRPTVADCAVFGLCAPFAFAPFDTPVASYVKKQPALMAWCRRVHDELFADR